MEFNNNRTIDAEERAQRRQRRAEYERQRQEYEDAVARQAEMARLVDEFCKILLLFIAWWIVFM